MKTAEWLRTGLLALGMVGATVAPALAVPVYDTLVAPADRTGPTANRTVSGGGLVGGGGWGSPDNLKIEWDITAITGGYHYKYTFSGGFDTPGISHVILDLSDDCSATTGCVGNSSVTTLVYDDDFGPGPSNPGFPAGATIGGIKFDDLDDEIASFTIEFDSNRIPVWGDIYVKGGTDSFAHNTGLGSAVHDTTGEKNLFVARPDTTTVPMPSALILLLVGGVVGGIRGLRSRQ
jgi:hypothetical protein